MVFIFKILLLQKCYVSVITQNIYAFGGFFSFFSPETFPRGVVCSLYVPPDPRWALFHGLDVHSPVDGPVGGFLFWGYLGVIRNKTEIDTELQACV